MIFGKHDEFPEKGAPFSGTFWLPEKFLATVAYFSGSGQAKKQHKKKIPEKPFSGTVFREAKGRIARTKKKLSTKRFVEMFC